MKRNMKILAEYLGDKDPSYICHYLARLEGAYLYSGQIPCFKIIDINYKDSKITVQPCIVDKEEECKTYTVDDIFGDYSFPRTTFVFNKKFYKLDKKKRTYIFKADEEYVSFKGWHYKISDIKDELCCVTSYL